MLYDRNFGDILMAALFGSALKQLGCEPWVYRLHEETARRHGLRSCGTITELLEGAELLVLGGGGLLYSVPRLSALFRGYSRKRTRDWKALMHGVERHQTPVAAFSVGSDGSPNISRFLPATRRFWTRTAIDPTTVRLAKDVALLASMGKQATYAPDVVLTLSVRDPVSRARPSFRERLRVGVCLRGLADPASVVSRYAARSPRADFVLLSARLNRFAERDAPRPGSRTQNLMARPAARLEELCHNRTAAHKKARPHGG